MTQVSVINTKELRIGNYVNLFKGIDDDGSDWVLCEVLMVSPNKVDLIDPLISQIFRSDIYSITPIPIAEEWLIKFGFTGRVDFKWKNNIGIQIVDGKFYFALKDMGNVFFHSIIECKYVHDLQNLHFMLTGKELEQVK